MTGFLIIRRGSSFLKVSLYSVRRCSSRKAMAFYGSYEPPARFRTCCPWSIRKCSDDRSQRQYGQEIQCPDQQHRAQQQDDERTKGRPPERAVAGGDKLLCASEPASAMIGTIIRFQPYRRSHQATPQGGVVPKGVFAFRPAKRRCRYCPRRRNRCTRDFAQAVRSLVVPPSPLIPMNSRRPRR